MTLYATPEPIDLPAPSPGVNPALLVFLHGFDDDGIAFRGLAGYLQSQPNLSHLHVILPTAPLDHESMARAWYPVASFSPVPVGRSSGDTKVAFAGSDPTDTEALTESAGNVLKMASEAAESKGVSMDRVVIGGFSQGAAISLAIGVGETQRKLADSPNAIAGVIGLCGYLPHLPGVEQILSDSDKVVPHASLVKNYFVAQGGRDMLIPKWLGRETCERVQAIATKAASIDSEGKQAVAIKTYEGVAHTISSSMAVDMVKWLEDVVGK